MLQTKIYVAYGSNLNVTQMHNRCSHAKLLGTGTIKGYELLFRGTNGSAVGTIEANSNFNVPVALWKISLSDEHRLDIYEGFPKFYRKEILTVTLENNEKINAMVYLINYGEIASPSSYYYGIIEQGYLDNGIDLSYLKEAVRKSQTRR